MSWGEIYNTSWWGVALDTARTVKARPDFFGSQLNLLTSEQPNLVVNGTFDTDSDWIFNTGWSMGDGVAIGNASIGTGSIYQQGVFEIGKKYQLKLDATLTSGSFKLEGSGGSTLATFNETKSYDVIIEATQVDLMFRRITSSFIGSIDNVSVQLVRADLDQIEAKKCLADWIHTTALKDLNN